MPAGNLKTNRWINPATLGFIPLGRPVVLSRGNRPAWLGEEPASVPQLKTLLAPYPSEEMTCWPISMRVGNVKNNDPSLIEPIGVK